MTTLTIKIGAGVQPIPRPSSRIVFKSSNPEIAYVSPNGLISGVSKGKTSVTATDEQGYTMWEIVVT